MKMKSLQIEVEEIIQETKPGLEKIVSLRFHAAIDSFLIKPSRTKCLEVTFFYFSIQSLTQLCSYCY